MKKSLRRISAFALVAAMLITFAQWNVFAADVASVDVPASADLYIEKAGGGAGALANYSTKDEMFFQRNGNYHREVWVQFDFSGINIPEGMQIESANITLYLKTYFNQSSGTSNKNAAKMDVLTLSSQDYDPATVAWNTPNRPQSSSVIATTTLCPDDTFADKTAYSFDVSSYFAAMNTLPQKETFAFFPNAELNKISGSFYTNEAAGGAYAPKLTLTFKPMTSTTLKAFDAAIAYEDSYTSAVGNSKEYSIQNNGTSKSNRVAYVMFDLAEANVPAGKVITKATLQLYAFRNYNQKDSYIRIHNIENDTWISKDDLSIALDDAPEFAEIKSGLNADVSISGIGLVPYNGTNSIVESYIDFDVTEFVTNEYYTDADSLVSFAAYPDAIRSKGALAIGSSKMVGGEPRLVLEYGDEQPITVDNVKFSQKELGLTCTALPKSGITYVSVGMNGASSTPTKMKLYIAQYDKETDMLVDVKIREADIYSASGTLSYGYYPHSPGEGTHYTKVYVWDDGMKALTEVNAIDFQ